METLPFLSAFRKRITSSDSRKVHCAVFLAQSFTRSYCYSFSLMRGRVFSEDLGQDLVVLLTERFAAAADALSSSSHPSYKGEERLSDQLKWLLDQDTEVVEAAATLRFYNDEGLGDPLKKLRWYSELSPGIRSAATQLYADAQA
jgi:hypothetical protein